MKFWDSSALVPLLVEQPASEPMHAIARSDSRMVVWWGTRVECVSAVSRLERVERRLVLEQSMIALLRLDRIANEWHEIEPSENLRALAQRLLRVHSLRAGDALQLAAAIVAAENHPPSLEFVCLDERLSVAAMKEGFRLVTP